MESSLGKLGEMMKGMFFEFYTAPRRLQILGPDSITEQDVEYYEPGTLFPSHMAWEDKSTPSIYGPVERARHFMDSFFFKITPNSLHSITQMSRKLLYIQLQKTGQPIDPWTMAEICDIPNFGRAPEGAQTVMQRFVAWERMKGELTAEVQANAQEVLANQQMASQMKMAALQQGMMGAIAGDPNQPQPGTPPESLSPGPAMGQSPPGRPPQFGGTPVIEQKDGGTRSTITSK
jgi:hypothetical protein